MMIEEKVPTATNGSVSHDVRPVQRAIANRRTIRSFIDRPVRRELIERLLEAAVQAPNHKRTAPWRFFVLDGPGATREQLGQLAFEATMERVVNKADPGAVERAEAKRQEIFTTPTLIAVYSMPGRTEVETRENYGAVCCAVQNLMLAAVEEGLASGWSTGGICGHPRLAEVLGADPAWDMVAMLYLGYAQAGAGNDLPRGPIETVTRWIID